MFGRRKKSEAFADAELEMYLDENLPAEDMARLERALRIDTALTARLMDINRRRDSGMHSLGAIWRRHRISCPTREQWGSYLLNVLPAEEQQYYDFHLAQVGCRLCRANLDDLRAQLQKSADEVVQKRRKKYFQTSAGYLSCEPQ